MTGHRVGKGSKDGAVSKALCFKRPIGWNPILPMGLFFVKEQGRSHLHLEGQGELSEVVVCCHEPEPVVYLLKSTQVESGEAPIVFDVAEDGLHVHRVPLSEFRATLCMEHVSVG